MAIGSHRLFQQGAIIKRMSVVEDISWMDVLCSDKTSTLTLTSWVSIKAWSRSFVEVLDKEYVLLLHSFYTVFVCTITACCLQVFVGRIIPPQQLFRITVFAALLLVFLVGWRDWWLFLRFSDYYTLPYGRRIPLRNLFW